MKHWAPPDFEELSVPQVAAIVEGFLQGRFIFAPEQIPFDDCDGLVRFEGRTDGTLAFTYTLLVKAAYEIVRTETKQVGPIQVINEYVYSLMRYGEADKVERANRVIVMIPFKKIIALEEPEKELTIEDPSRG